MKRLLSLIGGVLLGAAAGFSQIPEIERKIPPVSKLEFPTEEREKIEARLSDYEDRLYELAGEPFEGDVAVFAKAVRFALRNNEFYSEKEFSLPAKMLDLADARYEERAKEEPTASWRDQRGMLVRGYRSSIDDSVQPYGLEIPEKLDLSKPVPLLVWLHGRGDKTTDLHFINRCLGKSQALGGKIADQQNAIIVHAFGRHCVGFKYAGEIDVLEVIDAVKAEYPIDPNKVALAGFSMGGAGAWHVGAHYRDQFCAVHAGAGFAETKFYNKLTPENLPVDYVQTLWSLYDVPNYTRNFFNGPVLAYSGEDDKQKQAADLMAEAFEAEGETLKHIIGPGMGHRYHDDSAKEIWAWLNDIWDKGGRDPFPKKIELQTATLRYGKMFWFTATGLEKHWEDSRASATWDEAAKKISVASKNITAFRIDASKTVDLGAYELEIDGQKLKSESPGFSITSLFAHRSADGTWAWGEIAGLTKTRHLQGPIDDAFLSKFIVVPPDSVDKNEKFDAWIDFEMNHFKNRWIELMRGEYAFENSGALDSLDVSESNLVLWGTPSTNLMIAEIIDQLPIEWTDETLKIGGQTFDPKTHVPSFIYPNPVAPNRYIVINSGLTFREGHDRTNSLQNPKLPDWAVTNFETNPNDLTAGEVVATGFFSETWK
ncbi:prolyl oligopeptidase family serine peptidase [Verrucomicrobiales bacterium]|nr:prolyl oligopeptidase family serine peptidase [Verrucomicrobiales bacterium]